MLDSSAIVVAIDPVEDPSNSFVELFSGAVAAGGNVVRQLEWDDLGGFTGDVIILHWPGKLLFVDRGRNLAAIARRYAALARLRRRGVRLVWVAHNVKPHDSGLSAALMMRIFLRSLDGIIHLSNSSRHILEQTYSISPKLRQVETVHGHYGTAMKTPLAPPPSLGDTVRLCYFGQVRRYKNVELLARLVAASSRPVELVVSGRRSDAGLAAELEAIAAGTDRIRLDVRGAPLPDEDIEAAIDGAHAVVLPYRNILNSGAALMALSRNRPILAPRMGSLPELEAAVGLDWVRLFDGELSQDALDDFVGWAAARPRDMVPELSAYGWDRVGRDINGFIRQLVARHVA